LLVIWTRTRGTGHTLTLASYGGRGVVSVATDMLGLYRDNVNSSV
jgi:hypothetical protein